MRINPWLALLFALVPLIYVPSSVDPFKFVKQHAQHFAILALFLYWLFSPADKKRALYFPAAWITLLVFWAWNILSVSRAVNSWEALQESHRLAFLVLLVFLAPNFIALFPAAEPWLLSVWGAVQLFLMAVGSYDLVTDVINKPQG